MTAVVGWVAIVAMAVVLVGAAFWWLASIPFCRPPDDFELWERQLSSRYHVNPRWWDLTESVDPVRDIGDGRS